MLTTTISATSPVCLRSLPPRWRTGERAAIRGGSGIGRYPLTDHLGSTAKTVNTDATVYGELRYKAWGETRYTWGTTPTKYRCTGQREESTIGLYFYGARWYDPALARFVQPDTLVQSQECSLTVSYVEPSILQHCNGAHNPASRLAETQTLNRYSYAANSPLTYGDPDGHVAWLTAALGLAFDVGPDFVIAKVTDEKFDLAASVATNVTIDVLTAGLGGKSPRRRI